MSSIDESGAGSAGDSEAAAEAGVGSQGAAELTGDAPTGWESLRAMWVFTLLRFAIFGIVWGLLFLASVPGFLAAVIALALSIPLSFVLLRKPREQLAINLERRVAARRFKTENLDSQLSGDE